MSSDLDEAENALRVGAIARTDLTQNASDAAYKMAAAALTGMAHVVKRLRSRPPASPPPPAPSSPSEENAGEDLTDQYIREVEIAEKARAEGYKAGKKHQASADAATIAGSREKVAAWEPVVRAAIDWHTVKPETHEEGEAALNLTGAVEDLPASLRTEPGGTK